MLTTALNGAPSACESASSNADVSISLMTIAWPGEANAAHAARTPAPTTDLKALEAISPTPVAGRHRGQSSVRHASFMPKRFIFNFEGASEPVNPPL
jgi:hypothetical protein